MGLKAVRNKRKQARLRTLARRPDLPAPSPSQQPEGRITGMDDGCTLPRVRIYTDGSCDVNSGRGGWGCVLVGQHKTQELAGAELDTTNNCMELRAVIEALRSLRCPCNILLFSDSRYVVKGMAEWVSAWIRNGWRTAGGAPVKNRSLWETLVVEAKRHQIRWHWVKAHSGHNLNSRADWLARGARRRLFYQ